MLKVTPNLLEKLSVAIRTSGILAAAFYLVILLIHVGDIGILDVHNDGDIISTSDLPLGLLLTVEIICSVLMALGGCFSKLAKQNKRTRYALFIITLLTFIAFMTSLVFRAMKLWGNAEGQCNYFGKASDGQYGDYINACPTTRHENQGASEGVFWKIERIEPTLESDCVFWFWDNTFTLDSVIKGNSGKIINTTYRTNLKDVMVENMDWTQKHMYGYYGCKQTNCLSDGRAVFHEIEARTDLGVPIVKKLGNSNSLPDISYCYYWGCSSVCNPDRYRINRILLYTSFVMSAISLLYFIAAGIFIANRAVGFDDEEDKQDESVIKEPEAVKWKPMNVKSGVYNRSTKRQLRF